MEKNGQEGISFIALGESQVINSCSNLQKGICIARRTCAKILAGTHQSTDPIVLCGRRIAGEIVAHGATFERKDGTCGAPSQEEAERCNGFM